MRKIGVFDSGVGGKSVAIAIEKAFPNYKVMFVNDAEHVPYGTRAPEEILTFVQPILEDLVAKGCEVIVIACNTVSTTLITELRELFSVPLVALEPMVKPAAGITKSNVITVCATPTTLASKRYKDLKQEFAPNIQVIEPDCSDWSSLIEKNEITTGKIAEDILPSIAAGSDVIVLGCTHYHWIESEILEIVGTKAIVLQPEPAIVRQLTRVLSQLD